MSDWKIEDDLLEKPDEYQSLNSILNSGFCYTANDNIGRRLLKPRMEVAMRILLAKTQIKEIKGGSNDPYGTSFDSG